MSNVLESVIIQSTLSAVEPSVFEECRDVKMVGFLEGRKTLGGNGEDASVWNKIFRDSRAEGVVLPGTLAEIPQDIFEDCADLRVVRVAEGCPLDVEKYVGEDVEVLRE